MVEKTVNTLATIGKVAVVGAYVAALSYDIYQNWNSSSNASTSQKPESEENKGNGQEEEKKEPVQY